MENKENEVVFLHLDDIIPNRFQPRQVFDEKALKELAVSIKEHGVIQPIIVRNIGNKYEIIAGERRYKASALAGLTKIPAIIRNLDDKESSKVALLENLQRKNLNPIEEAKTYQKILELDQMTQEELAKTMGKSQSAVANKIRLLALTDEVQDALLKDQISERHARTLLNAKDIETQKRLLKETIDNRLTVRELEEKIKPKEELTPKDIDNLLNQAPIKINNNENEILNYENEITKNDNNFNTSIGIDYSTPPKFIDYDIPNINDNLESTASKPIDINNIRNNAQDINVERPINSVNEFFKIPKQEPNLVSETSNNFKFFAPSEEEQIKEDSSKTTNVFAPPTPTNNSFDNIDPFKLGEETKNLKDTTSTSMDNLLSSVNNNLTKTEPQISSVDNFNNPFAHNPIFKDNIELDTKESNDKPHYNLNESIELIRKTLKQIELSGHKVDSEEIDLINNYEIRIKIAKENNQQ